jgi:hypothetical protein
MFLFKSSLAQFKLSAETVSAVKTVSGAGLSNMHKDLHDHDLDGPCAAGYALYTATHRRNKSRHLPTTARKNLFSHHAVKHL